MIIAGEYCEFYEEHLKAVNIGVNQSDLPDYPYDLGDLDHNYDVSKVPAIFYRKLGRTTGVVTEAMVKKTGDTHTLGLYKDCYDDLLGMNFTSELADRLEVDSTNPFEASLIYTSK